MAAQETKYNATKILQTGTVIKCRLYKQIEESAEHTENST